MRADYGRRAGSITLLRETGKPAWRQEVSRFVLANKGRTIYAQMSADGSEMEVFVRGHAKSGVSDGMSAARETGTHLLEALDLLPRASRRLVGGAQRGARAKAKTAVAHEPDNIFNCLRGCYTFQEQIGPSGKPISLAEDGAGNTVVVKMLPNDREGKNEIDINRQLQELNDPHLLNCLDVGMKNGELLLVSEFAQFGVLSEQWEKAEKLRKTPRSQLTPELRRVRKNLDAVFLLILRDVLKGLAALHARGCVHRDLRPENIFIAVGGIGKVGDFGTTRKAGQVTERSNQTPHNQAPEDIAGNLKLAASLAKREKCKSELQTLMAEGVLTLDSAKERLAKFDRNEIQGYGLTQAADMYAFGLLCHKLLHGQDLVKGDELTVRGEALFLAYTTVKTPKDTPVNHRRRGGIEELINACKQRSEEKRPTAECLLKNEVFAEFEDERTEVSVRSMWMTLLKADLT